MLRSFLRRYLRSLRERRRTAVTRRWSRSKDLNYGNLHLEHLEDRRLLSTYPVTNLLDSGAGSLRDAIGLANANPGPDTITFDVAGQIDVSSELPALTDPDIPLEFSGNFGNSCLGLRVLMTSGFF